MRKLRRMACYFKIAHLLRNKSPANWAALFA